jgi:hypothetical protein
MDHLSEGESFTIQSQNEMLEIIKRNGKAIVKVLEAETAESTKDRERVTNFH